MISLMIIRCKRPGTLLMFLGLPVNSRVSPLPHRTTEPENGIQV